MYFSSILHELSILFFPFDINRQSLLIFIQVILKLKQQTFKKDNLHKYKQFIIRNQDHNKLIQSEMHDISF